MSVRRRRLILTPDARQDIRDVLIYTEHKWGKTQRRSYKQALYVAFSELTQFLELGRPRHEYGTGVRGFLFRQQVVVYQATDVELRIARVLHVRPDIESELAEPPP